MPLYQSLFDLVQDTGYVRQRPDDKKFNIKHHVHLYINAQRVEILKNMVVNSFFI